MNSAEADQMLQTHPGDENPDHLERLLYPERVAVIGSTSKPTGFGRRTVVHLENADFAGRVIVAGSPAEIDEPVDVAIVAVPSAVVPRVLEGLKGRASNAIVFSSGFAETGDGSLRRFHDQDLSVLGPNTVGLYYAPSKAVLTFAVAFDDQVDCRAGSGVMLVAQSGAFGSRLARASARRGLPLDGFIATGNEDGYRATTVMESLVASDRLRPKLILLYLEGIASGSELCRAFEAAHEAGVSLALLHGGRSSAGSSAATSHTAAVSADADVVAEICRYYGVFVARSDRELLDAAVALSSVGASAGRRVAVVTGSGGAGVVAADLLSGAGLAIPQLSGTACTSLRELLPPYAGYANPVDVTAQVISDTAKMAQVCGVLAASGEIDAILAIGRSDQCEPMKAAGARSGVPVTTVVLDGDRETTEPYVRQGLPLFGDLASACSGVAASAAVGTAGISRKDLPPARPDSGAVADFVAGPTRHRHQWDGGASLAEISSVGVPCASYRVVSTVAEAEEAGDALGWPVVVKTNGPAAVHKAVQGGVRLDVTAATIGSVAWELLSVTGSLIVARQVRGAPELFVGIRRDPVFGLIMAAGLGGGNMELLRRTVAMPVGLPQPWFARRLRDEIFGQHRQGSGWSDLLAATAIRLAALAERTGADLVECNPVVDVDGVLVALDARVVREEGGR